MITRVGKLGTATFSDDETLRYTLVREWDADLPRLMAMLLNPSKADHDRSDNTVTRVIDFAKAWGFGSLVVTNMWPIRETKSKLAKEWAKVAIFDHARRLEMEINWTHVDLAAEDCSAILVGWGANATEEESEEMIVRLKATGHPVFALVINADGTPKHPLYVPKITERIAL